MPAAVFLNLWKCNVFTASYSSETAHSVRETARRFRSRFLAQRERDEIRGLGLVQ